MGLYPQTIGGTMPNGFAGTYARQPDMIINTRPLGGAANVPFGAPLIYSGTNVVLMGAGATAPQFVGIAAFEIKSSLTYLTQSQGQYAPNDPVPVFMRGSVNVKCQKGVPALGGAVYVRIAANATYPTAAVGGFEAEADAANTVKLNDCQWAGTADTNGIAELRILTMNNA